MKTEIKKGKVWLVGAGPGDAGLLTLRGREVLDSRRGQSDLCGKAGRLPHKEPVRD